MSTASPQGSGGSRRSTGPSVAALPPSNPLVPAPPGSDLEQAIALLQARVEEEFRISERLDSKARQLFALAAAVFAAAQAAAVASLDGSANTSGTGRLIVLVSAVSGALMLLLVGQRLANFEEPMEEKNLDPDEVRDWIEENEGEEPVLLAILGGLSRLAKDRSRNNKARKDRYGPLQSAARWSLIISVVELFLAIGVRL